MLKLTNLVRTSLVDEGVAKKYVPFESYKKMSLILDLLMSSPEYNSKVVLSMPLKYKEYIGASEYTKKWEIELPYNIVDISGRLILFNAIQQDFPEIDIYDAAAFSLCATHYTNITEEHPYGWTASTPNLNDVNNVKSHILEMLT